MKIYSPAPPTAYQAMHGLKINDILLLLRDDDEADKVWNLLWLVEPGFDAWLTPEPTPFYKIDKTLDAIMEFTKDEHYDWIFADMAAGKLGQALRKLAALSGFKGLQMTRLKGEDWVIKGLERLQQFGHAEPPAHAATMTQSSQSPEPPGDIPKTSGVVISVNFRSR